MEIEIKVWLYDILKAIEEIESFFENQPKDFLKYQKDFKLKRAVERNIEIIGEAVNRIVKANTSIRISYARNIIDTRNRISHGYDSVSDDIIWGIVINHLSKLKKEVQELLKQ